MLRDGRVATLFSFCFKGAHNTIWGVYNTLGGKHTIERFVLPLPDLGALRAHIGFYQFKVLVKTGVFHGF